MDFAFQLVLQPCCILSFGNVRDAIAIVTSQFHATMYKANQVCRLSHKRMQGLPSQASVPQAAAAAHSCHAKTGTATCSASPAASRLQQGVHCLIAQVDLASRYWQLLCLQSLPHRVVVLGCWLWQHLDQPECQKLSSCL